MDISGRPCCGAGPAAAGRAAPTPSGRPGSWAGPRASARRAPGWGWSAGPSASRPDPSAARPPQPGQPGHVARRHRPVPGFLPGARQARIRGCWWRAPFLPRGIGWRVCPPDPGGAAGRGTGAAAVAVPAAPRAPRGTVEFRPGEFRRDPGQVVLPPGLRRVLGEQPLGWLPVAPHHRVGDVENVADPSQSIRSRSQMIWSDSLGVSDDLVRMECAAGSDPRPGGRAVVSERTSRWPPA